MFKGFENLMGFSKGKEESKKEPFVTKKIEKNKYGSMTLDEETREELEGVVEEAGKERKLTPRELHKPSKESTKNTTKTISSVTSVGRLDKQDQEDSPVHPPTIEDLRKEIEEKDPAVKESGGLVHHEPENEIESEFEPEDEKKKETARVHVPKKSGNIENKKTARIYLPGEEK